MQHVREDPLPSLQRLILARRPWRAEHIGHGRQSPPRATSRSQMCDSSESLQAAYLQLKLFQYFYTSTLCLRVTTITKIMFLRDLGRMHLAHIWSRASKNVPHTIVSEK